MSLSTITIEIEIGTKLAGLISRRSVDRALPCAISFHPWERCFTLISSVHPAVFKMGTGREDSERIVGCLSCSAY